MIRGRVAILIAASFVTAACGAVLGLEPIDFVDGSTQGEGGLASSTPDAKDDVAVRADGGDPRADADTDANADAGPALGFCDGLDGGLDGATILFCDDFERAAPLEKNWIGASTNGGSVSLSTEASVSGTRSLLMNLPAGASAGTKSALLTTPTPPLGVKVVTLEMDIRVEIGPPATGSYPGNGFILGRSYNVGGGYKAAFITTPADGTFSPGFFPQDAPPVPAFVTATWHHLVWSIVDTTMTLEVRPRAGGASIVRTAPEPQDPARFVVGAETDANLGPAKMFIDDIVMYR
jgi:hypothetical protein